jgi:cyclopropane-fatty-acyl-phospholipid synthase
LQPGQRLLDVGCGWGSFAIRIGMVEHVGDERIDLYAQSLARVLRPNGLLLNHGIAVARMEEEGYQDPIFMRYIFPDENTLPLWRVEQAVRRAGLFTEHIEGFQQDYADTLTHWYQRFIARYDEAERLAGKDRARIWKLYLMVCKMFFESGDLRVYQVLASKPE